MPLHAIIMTRFRQIWNPGCYSSLTLNQRILYIPEFSLARTFKNRDLLWQTGSQFTNSPGTFFRAAAQIPLHKMYTFVYRTFIKFILFCRGQALFFRWEIMLNIDNIKNHIHHAIKITYNLHRRLFKIIINRQCIIFMIILIQKFFNFFKTLISIS